MPDSDTKTALLDRAQELIQSVGVNAMSYNDLSVSVGIRKASIHYHFPKKDKLIEALLDRCSETYGQRYREVASSADPVLAKLKALTEIFEQSLLEGKICTAGMLSVEVATLSEPLQTALKTTVEGSVRIIESIFLQGVADQTFPPEMDTNAAAHAFHNFLLGSQIMARCLQDPVHFRRSAATYLELLSAH